MIRLELAPLDFLGLVRDGFAAGLRVGVSAGTKLSFNSWISSALRGLGGAVAGGATRAGEGVADRKTEGMMRSMIDLKPQPVVRGVWFCAVEFRAGVDVSSRTFPPFVCVGVGSSV